MQLAYFLSVISVAAPAIIGLINYRRLSKQFKFIVILMSLGFLTEISLILIAINGNANHYLINFYSICEILLLAGYFARILLNQKIKFAVGITGGIVATAFLLEMLFVGVNIWSSYASLAESLVIIGWGLCYYYEVATAKTPGNVLKQGEFWITTIMLLYFMVSMEYYLLNRYLINVNSNYLGLLAGIHTFTNAFCNLALATVLWIQNRLYSSVR